MQTFCTIAGAVFVVGFGLFLAAVALVLFDQHREKRRANPFFEEIAACCHEIERWCATDFKVTETAKRIRLSMECSQERYNNDGKSDIRIEHIDAFRDRVLGKDWRNEVEKRET
jgi:hypothetical protein